MFNIIFYLNFCNLCFCLFLSCFVYSIAFIYFHFWFSNFSTSTCLFQIWFWCYFISTNSVNRNQTDVESASLCLCVCRGMCGMKLAKCGTLTKTLIHSVSHLLHLCVSVQRTCKELNLLLMTHCLIFCSSCIGNHSWIVLSHLWTLLSYRLLLACCFRRCYIYMWPYYYFWYYPRSLCFHTM